MIVYGEDKSNVVFFAFLPSWMAVEEITISVFVLKFAFLHEVVGL